MLSGRGLPILKMRTPHQPKNTKRSEYALAEIASTRLEPRTVMVAPPVHPGMRPTARPRKRARKIEQQLLLIPSELVLEFRSKLPSWKLSSRQRRYLSYHLRGIPQKRLCFLQSASWHSLPKRTTWNQTGAKDRHVVKSAYRNRIVLGSEST
jgi:hypothetical protein